MVLGRISLVDAAALRAVLRGPIALGRTREDSEREDAKSGMWRRIFSVSETVEATTHVAQHPPAPPGGLKFHPCRRLFAEIPNQD